MNLHTHFSFISAAQAFIGVLVFGTLWRLSAAHLIATENDQLQHVGKSMLFQY